MSMAVSRAHSEVISASQLGPQFSRFAINYFLLPNFLIHIIGLAALTALWYYLR